MKKNPVVWEISSFLIHEISIDIHVPKAFEKLDRKVCNKIINPAVQLSPFNYGGNFNTKMKSEKSIIFV